MDIENEENVVQEQPVPALKKERKPRTKKAEATLILPVPTQIDGAKDTTLVAAIAKRFSAIQFYTSNKAGAKPDIIVHSTENPKLEKYPGTAMYNFICALANATMGGAGLSPDGSCLYVEANAKKVMASAPKFSGYIMELVPAGRAGVTAYRGTVGDFITLATVKARILRTSLQAGRTMGRKTREVTEKSTKKAVQVVF
jgi:hypothetical protein